MARSAAPRLLVQVFNLSGDVEKTFRAEEKSIPRTWQTAAHAEKTMQIRVRLARAETEVFRTALGVETTGHSDGFQQGGFSRSVLTDQKRDLRVKLQGVERAHRRQRERVVVERRHLVPLQADVRHVLFRNHGYRPEASGSGMRPSSNLHGPATGLLLHHAENDQHDDRTDGGEENAAEVEGLDFPVAEHGSEKSRHHGTDPAQLLSILITLSMSAI